MYRERVERRISSLWELRVAGIATSGACFCQQRSKHRGSADSGRREEPPACVLCVRDGRKKKRLQQRVCANISKAGAWGSMDANSCFIMCSVFALRKIKRGENESSLCVCASLSYSNADCRMERASRLLFMTLAGGEGCL
jgi:hypothetical protein